MSQGVLVVSLADGKVVVSAGDEKRTFAHEDTEKIGDFLAEQEPHRIMYSSSVSHPDEYGFPEDFNLDPFLAKAEAHARMKTAVRFPPHPLQEATEALEAATASAPKDRPVAVLFLQAGKEGQDALVEFAGESELEMFLGGMRYARNLAKLTSKD
jgi:hypothetical protein